MLSFLFIIENNIIKQMQINSRRIYDKWILPKNNNKLSRHRVYVAFVVHFFNSYDRFPTVKEYLDGIVTFLINSGANENGKKTAEYHQLFQPVFFEMLKIENGKVIPTQMGLAFMLDFTGLFVSEIVFSLFSKANFGTGATGSNAEYDSVKPIFLLFANLVKYGKISYDELNSLFHTKNNILDLKMEQPVFEKSPQWKYVLDMLVSAELITRHGTSAVSLNDESYNGNSYIEPTRKLIDLYENNSERKLLEKFNIQLDEVDVKKIIDASQQIFNKNKKNTSGRNASDQAAYRTLLIEKHKACQMCGISNPIVLVASHIKPYSKCSKEEAFDVNNGLLLCDAHDGLFDSGLISLDDLGNVIFSKKMTRSDIDKFELLGFKKILLSSNMIEYIVFHRENELLK